MRIFLWVSFLALAACSDPFIIIPGSALSGDVNDAPERWQGVPDTVQLETRPADPYSVNIWAVGADRDLYVATGEDGTRWTAYIGSDPRVRVRWDNQVYELTAVAVTEEVERVKVFAAYVEKYDTDPDDGFVESGLIYRLDRR